MTKNEIIELINVSSETLRKVEEHLKNLLADGALVYDMRELLLEPIEAVHGDMDEIHDFIMDEVDD